MHLLTCRTSDGETLGVAAGDRWQPVAELVSNGARTMADLIAAGPDALGAGRCRCHDRHRAGWAAAERGRLPGPVPRPGKVVAIGRNYREHAVEEGVDPTAPLIFAKWPSSVVGAGSEIRWDPMLTDQVDYEAELAVVIGRTARRSRRPRPRACPWIHLSQRRLGTGPPVRRWAVGPRQVARHVLPDGPGPRDRRRDPRPAAVGHPLPVEGEALQDANTSQMYFSVAEIISHCSEAFTPRARRRHRHRHAVGCRRVSRSAAVPPRRGTRVVEIEGIGGSRTPAGSSASGRYDRPRQGGRTLLVTGALGASARGRARTLLHEGFPVVAFDLVATRAASCRSWSPTSWRRVTSSEATSPTSARSSARSTSTPSRT